MENIINEFYKVIGQHIRTIRKEKKMTLEDLAFEANIDWSFLARIETGKAVASLETLFKVSKALNVPVKRIFDNCTDDKPKENPEDKIYSFLNQLSFKEKQKMLKIMKLIAEYSHPNEKNNKK